MALLKFRKASLPDAQTLKEIANRVTRANYTSFLGEEAVDNFIENGLSDKEIDDGLDDCTVMTIEESIIGFCIVIDDLLHLIMVDTIYQNKGYGQKLLSFAEKMMFERHSTIRLQTFEKNTNASQFYLRNGWTITDKRFVPELNQEMLLLQKQYEQRC